MRRKTGKRQGKERRKPKEERKWEENKQRYGKLANK